MQGSAPRLTVGSQLFYASFCKVASGFEEETFEALHVAHPSVKCFKALGEYDIVAFAPEIARDGRDLPTSSSLISSCIHLPLVPLTWRNYSSPDLPSWVATSPVAALVLLEFDKSLYQDQRLTASISNVISHFQSLPAWSPESLALFAGIGQSELIAVLRTDCFEDIFHFVSACRCLTLDEIQEPHNGARASRLHVFSSTHTTPLISYPEVIVHAKGFDRIRGDVSAHVFVDCPTGFEANIRDSQFFPNSTTRSVLGTPDVLISIHSMPSGELIRRLLAFRKSNLLNPQITDTTTFLSFDVNFRKQAPFDYEQLAISEYPALSDKCPGFDNDDPHLAARIRAITHRIWSKLSLQSTHPLVARMQDVPMRLYGEVRHLIRNRRHQGDLASLCKGTLINLLEKAEIGFAQRTQSSFTSSGAALHIPPDYGDGAVASILAVENFVYFIFECFYETNPLPEIKSPGWKGYVFFQDTMGFQYTYSDVFSLPSLAISSVLSPDWNWTTLTHEISHAIFTILDIDDIDEELITEGGRRALSFYGEVLDERANEVNKNQFFELFAQWFDYYHFFDRDHDFYQKTIWRSWLSVPFVHKDQTEYIFRSFAVFVLTDIVSLHSSICAANESEYFADRWSDFLAFLHRELPEIAETIGFELKREPVLTLAADYLYPFSFLALKYRLDVFRTRLNRKPEDLDDQLDGIFAGAVISGTITNPFLLIREATRRASRLTPDVEIRAASAALIFSLRDAATLRLDFSTSG